MLMPTLLPLVCSSPFLSLFYTFYYLSSLYPHSFSIGLDNIGAGLIREATILQTDTKNWGILQNLYQHGYTHVTLHLPFRPLPPFPPIITLKVLTNMKKISIEFDCANGPSSCRVHRASRANGDCDAWYISKERR